MDTTDEIPLEDHRYFRGRLDHLESRHPAILLHHLEDGTLTEHLRDVTGRAMHALGNLVIDHQAAHCAGLETVEKQPGGGIIMHDDVRRFEHGDKGIAHRIRVVDKPHNDGFPVPHG